MVAQLLDVVISGLLNAAVYALLAMGMALTYGVAKIFNLAYGSLYSVAGYFAFVLFGLGFGYPLVFVIILPSLFILGMFLERFAVRPVRGKKDWEVLVVMITLGLALFLDSMDLNVFGPYLKKLPPLFEGTVKAGSVVVNYTDIAVFCFSIVVITALILFLRKTTLGMAIRATAQDPTGAAIVGIKANTIFAIVFGIATVMAGIGAVLLASRYFVSYKVGWEILYKAWLITAFGGMGSLSGAAIAAVILSMVEAFSLWQLSSNATQMIWFAILVLTFIFRPAGIRGSKV